MLKNRMKIKVPFLIKIFLLFFLVWIPALLLDLFGVKAQYNHFLTVIMNVYFVGMVVLSATVFFLRMKYTAVPVMLLEEKFMNKSKAFSRKLLNQIIRTAGGMSLIGIVLMSYDRIVIRGIDYSQGSRMARYQWGASSVSGTIFGIMGNLLVPFSYVALFCGYYYFEYLKSCKRIFAVFVGVAVPTVHAYLNGGRSNLLILVCFIGAIAIIRMTTEKKIIPDFKLKKVAVLLLIAVLGFYILSVFYQSITLGGVSLKEYVSILVKSLAGEYVNESDNSLVNNMIMVFSYLYHGQWMTGLIINTAVETRYGFYSLAIVNSIMSKVGINLNIQHNTELIAGCFLNVPGTLFYDFGWVGFLLGPIVLGFLLAFVSKSILCCRHFSNMKLIITFSIYMYMLCSPILPMTNYIYFVFVLYAFVLTGIFLSIRFKNFKWEKIV